MKRIKIITVFAFVFALLTALALTASAKWWDENPYKDVQSGAWYYDAVRICNENDVMYGVEDDEFGVNGLTSRAMFVTVLSKAAGFDDAQYTSTPFDDVAAGEWYTAAVAWANEKGITGGTGEGKFSPGSAISRQEMAVMLRRYAAFTGLDVSVKSATLDAFPDAFDVADWATESLCWAYENGIISGSAVDGEVLLLPRAAATRTQTAQMIVKLLALKPVREINGNDLSLYRIVYNENEEGSEDTSLESAEKLAGYIKNSLGYDLPIVKDTEEPTEYEILIGRTNREDAGLVTVDRDAFEDDQQYVYCVQGNRLVIAGIDEYAKKMPGRTGVNIPGTGNAIFDFAQSVLGIEFYPEGKSVYAPDPVISLPDGYSHTDRTFFRSRIIYMCSGEDAENNGCGYYYNESYCGVPHNLGNFIIGKPGGSVTWELPCLSDPDNMAALIANVKKYLDDNPHKNMLGLIQNDNPNYCRCADCAAAYREDGSRSAMIIRACNAVCEALEEDYPEVKILTWAYGYSAKPPKVTRPHKNLIVVYNTLILCPAHAYTDATCEFNKTSPENLEGWCDITNEVFLWDHSGAFVRAMTPFPDWDSILENVRYFADHNVRDVFMNGMSSLNTDFNELREKMLSMAYIDPYMAREEFDYHMDRFLAAYYGDGWRWLRKYIDTITELGNAMHHSFHDLTHLYYDYSQVVPLVDEIDSWWDKAEAGARDEVELSHVQLCRYSWIYLKQCATYDTLFVNGTEEEREAYRERSIALKDAIDEYDLRFTESEDITAFNVNVSPEYWG